MISCLINGEANSALPVSDRAIQYGDGLFETIAVRKGIIPFWDKHYQRLLQGCDRLHIPAPKESILLQETDQIINKQKDLIVKIIITRGNSERGYRVPSPIDPARIVQAFSITDYSSHYKNGILALFCKTNVSENPVLAGIKHLNRLDNVLASAELNNTPAAEGIMLSKENYVICGTKSNIFYVKNNELYTPKLNNAGVAGVMRAQILEWAPETKIMSFSKNELLQADEIFITNSIFGIWPVVQLEAHTFSIGRLTQQLQRLYDAQIL